MRTTKSTNETSKDADYDGRSGPAIRLIEWGTAFTILVSGPFLILFLLFLSAMAFAVKYPSLPIIIMIAGGIGWIWAVISHFRGYLFDEGNDQLTYPRYFFRRTIRISEIHDANSQTTTSHSTFDPARTIGESRPTKVKTTTYAVNLSGGFGLRRLTFGRKARRDEFLSYLHHLAPDVRITRWS